MPLAEIYAFVGKHGSRKSSTIRALIGSGSWGEWGYEVKKVDGTSDYVSDFSDLCVWLPFMRLSHLYPVKAL
jgi:hypothetical protein